MASDVELGVWFVREVLPLEPPLTRFLGRNWRDRSEISDLRQEVYARVFEAARNGIPRQIKPFVFSAARNLLIDRVRRARIISIETVADLELSTVLVDDTDPERVAIDRDELRKLRSALAGLPPRYREVVEMRKIEGLSQRDMAARLGLAESTVEKHVAKGVRLLAEILYGDRPRSSLRPVEVMRRADEG